MAVPSEPYSSAEASPVELLSADASSGNTSPTEASSGKSPSIKKKILQEAIQTYKAQPEYLWASHPEYAVLRHKENQKWFAVFMNVSRARLGLTGGGNAEILNVKCDPDMIPSLLSAKGILPAYHMNKRHWISILLDGTTGTGQVLQLLSISYERTAGKPAENRRRVSF